MLHIRPASRFKRRIVGTLVTVIALVICLGNLK